jgi:hypothetical protein
MTTWRAVTSAEGERTPVSQIVSPKAPAIRHRTAVGRGGDVAHRQRQRQRQAANANHSPRFALTVVRPPGRPRRRSGRSVAARAVPDQAGIYVTPANAACAPPSTT